MSYPLYFSNFIQYDGTHLLTESPMKDGISVTAPPEFHGEVGKWTPTELFLAGIHSAAILYLGHKLKTANIPLEKIESSLSAKLSNPDGEPDLGSLKLTLKIKLHNHYHISQVAEFVESLSQVVPEFKILKEPVRIEYSFK